MPAKHFVGHSNTLVKTPSLTRQQFAATNPTAICQTVAVKQPSKTAMRVCQSIPEHISVNNFIIQSSIFH